MITCTNCETAQFLQITQSRVYFEDGEMINEISETYECTLCGRPASTSTTTIARKRPSLARSSTRPNVQSTPDHCPLRGTETDEPNWVGRLRLQSERNASPFTPGKMLRMQ